MGMYEYDFSIADIKIRLNLEWELKMTDAFRTFAIPCDESFAPDYTVQFKEVSNLEILQNECIYKESRFSVYRCKNQTLLRAFSMETEKRKPYAVSIYKSGNHHIEVQYLKSAKKEFCDIQKAFLHVGLEWMLMETEKIMLHASCVKTPFGGLLFSGPSGIGKSTQAELWCQYGDGVLINGDKTILAKEKQWMAYGSPYAGSSGCYVNDSCPVRTILFLKHGKTCELKRCSVVEAFKKIYTGLTVNHWDIAYVDAVSRLAGQIALDVSVYEFVCTPDQTAVEYLKEKLLEGGG